MQHEFEIALQAAQLAGRHLMQEYARFQVIADAPADITTDAVLRLTPASDCSASRSLGTSPPNLSTKSFAALTIFLAFMRKKPVDLIICSTSATFALASACGVGYFLKSAGVVRLTRASVVCAERITDTSSSNGSV